MPTITFRRYSSTFFFPPIKRGKKPVKHAPKELEKQRMKRAEKAERDEYMDIGLCLSTVKRYIFTLQF